MLLNRKFRLGKKNFFNFLNKASWIKTLHNVAEAYWGNFYSFFAFLSNYKNLKTKKLLLILLFHSINVNLRTIGNTSNNRYITSSTMLEEMIEKIIQTFEYFVRKFVDTLSLLYTFMKRIFFKLCILG